MKPEHLLLFQSLIDAQTSCAFPCDARGHVDMDALSDAAREYYLYARAVMGREFDVPTVIEAIAADQFLAISGVVTATAGPTSIAGTLSGEFTLTKNAKPPFDVLATCSNEQHRVTFTR